ncbi:putative Leucine-rich repeat protein kinase family protein [Tripterygium wilfordii]|uniref:Putative Leucine-rich repeat protein kinase family protein n=1 Tax=Tripterygium wilfordii TaxID=458696 RepID=A0A7J7CHR6_TRIWF|nr:putative Leucine-rich repeat protein kinase family protein [Tripterygium wilfordii]
MGGIDPERPLLLAYINCKEDMLKMVDGIEPPIININTSLQYLDVSTNNMSCHLPLDVFYNLPQLDVLYLFENMFSGRILPSLFQCKQLIQIMLLQVSCGDY